MAQGGYTTYIDQSYGQVLALGPCLDPRVLPSMVESLDLNPAVEGISANNLTPELIRSIRHSNLIINDYYQLKDVAGYISSDRPGPSTLVYYGRVPSYNMVLEGSVNPHIRSLFLPLTGGLEYVSELKEIAVDGDYFYSGDIDRIRIIEKFRSHHPQVRVIAYFSQPQQHDYVMSKYQIETVMYCDVLLDQ